MRFHAFIHIQSSLNYYCYMYGLIVTMLFESFSKYLKFVQMSHLVTLQRKIHLFLQSPSFGLIFKVNQSGCHNLFDCLKFATCCRIYPSQNNRYENFIVQVFVKYASSPLDNLHIKVS